MREATPGTRHDPVHHRASIQIFGASSRRQRPQPLALRWSGRHCAFSASSLSETMLHSPETKQIRPRTEGPSYRATFSQCWRSRQWPRIRDERSWISSRQWPRIRGWTPPTVFCRLSSSRSLLLHRISDPVRYRQYTAAIQEQTAVRGPQDVATDQVTNILPITSPTLRTRHVKCLLDNSIPVSQVVAVLEDESVVLMMRLKRNFILCQRLIYSLCVALIIKYIYSM